MTTAYTIPKRSVGAGLTLDLDRAQIDVIGVRWTWTGALDHTGVPLMQAGDETPQRLTLLYSQLGPLIPEPRPVSAADRYAALATPTCTTGEQQDKQRPTPLSFAGLLGRLRGRSV